MIDIENVNFSYPGEGETLKNINLNIKRGECVVLCGKSGCGKTTVTKLINGLIPHFYEDYTLSGNVTISGKKVAEIEMYKLAKSVGSVFQNPKSQFFHLNSDAELAFGLENCGIPQKEMHDRIANTISQLNIEKLTNRNIFEMSGGEKQNLAFACVYTMNPDIYVLDEPTANLDEATIELLREQIKRVKSEGKTIIIAEHRLWFLADVIDRAVYMENGKIINIYSRNEFLALTDEQRIKMGLRRLTQMKIPLTNTNNDGCFSVNNLCYKIKGKTIFDNISFGVSDGEILGIIGSNGAGKSMLLRCIAGIIEPTSGKIKLDNKVLKKKMRNKLCYMIMQDVNHQLFSDSVYGECEIANDNIQSKLINDTLQEFDLTEFEESHPMALSGGQKQRLAIATGVLCSKKIILFDEPTSGLDFEHMCSVGKMLRRLAQKGHIIIVVTHDNELLECCADKILRL
ncbi:MAG: ABC transporter ATP-binding protein [Vallitalea sp.]|jgi:energy-coupling factor transport system ATP-binding protein|nr:ABC transporter ATP-binding protein [Vallitalea sp.]